MANVPIILGVAAVARCLGSCFAAPVLGAGLRPALAVQLGRHDHGYPAAVRVGTRRRARMERRIRLVRPSADDGEAIRAAAANFRNCLAGLWPLAERARHLAARRSKRNYAGLTPDLRIMDLLDAQPEFTKSPWDYLDILVNDARIAERPRDPGPASRDLRRDGESLWRRPPFRRRDLGRRIELRHA